MILRENSLSKAVFCWTKPVNMVKLTHRSIEQSERDRGRGAEGESENSQAKGSDWDDPPESIV